MFFNFKDILITINKILKKLEIIEGSINALECRMNAVDQSLNNLESGQRSPARTTFPVEVPITPYNPDHNRITCDFNDQIQRYNRRVTNTNS